VDHSGAPITDAYVAVWGADGSYIDDAPTDAQGRYLLPAVPEGAVRLSFQSESLVQWAPQALSQDAAQVYQVPADGTLTVDVQRLPAGVMSGVVTGADGAPAPWAPVDVHHLAHDTHVYAYTDDAGRYSVSVWAGDHRVGFGPDTAKQWAPRTLDERSADTFAVAAGATVRVDETLLPTGKFRGRLTAVDGGPLVWIEVMLYAGDRRIHAGWTGEDGVYEFPVLPGDYVLSFQRDVNVAEQFIPGQVDRAKATVHTVAAGQTVVADDSVLRPASVSGRLVDSGGRPQVDFHVYVSSTDDQHGYGAVTGSDGEWRVDDVQPADYRVSFSNPSMARTQWAYGKSVAADAQAITVAAGASVTVDDTWLPGATLTVKAVDEVTGAPVTNFCVDVEAGSGLAEGCASGGTATVTDLAPGPASVAVVPGEKTYFLRDDGNPVTLVAGESASVTVPLAKGGKVSFSAVDGVDGKAVPRTCFVLLQRGRGGLPDGGGNCGGALGKATSGTLAAGTYDVFAVAPGTYGHQWVGATGGTGDQRSAARVVVTADKTVAAPVARLDRAGSISGVVKGSDGTPIEDADVSFTAWSLGAGSSHSVTTNKRGRYTIGKLGPYAWPLSFTAAGHPRQWSGNVGNRFKAVHIPVVAGATATYDMALTSTSTLTGKVVVPADLPATGWRLTLVNAVTGDQMAEFDSYVQEPGGKFTVRVAGPQQVKVHWSARNEAGLDADGWHDHATDQASAKGVSIPASGTRKVTVTLG
jgi:hypothetical protein